MSIYIGLDLGTSGVKALAMRGSGEIITTTTAGYPLYQPRAGWTEQDPAEWWEAVVSVLRGLAEHPAVETQSITGLAISGQMHGSVFLDADNEVIRRPLLWNDTRTAPQCKMLRETVGEETFLQYTGNPVLEGFTAPKVMWLKENEPEHYQKLATLLLPKDYVVYKLTGRLCSEYSDAAGTLLFDVEHREWSEHLCKELDIDPSVLPEVVSSIETVGPVTGEVAETTGLPRDTKVVAGGADNACSAVGNGVVTEGTILTSIGSSGTVVAPSPQMQRDMEGRIHSFNHAVPDLWYLMGVMLSATLSLTWFRETFGTAESAVAKSLDTSPEELLTQAASRVSPGSEGVIFLPYLHGERTPHADPNARGLFFGLSGTHSKEHLARAVFEGVAFGLRDSLRLIRELNVPISEVRLTGGGARSSLWKQMIADMFDQEVVTTSTTEGPAFGAALIAATGTGQFASLEEATTELVTLQERISPQQETVRIYDQIYPLYRALYQSLRENYAEAKSIYESINPTG